MSAQGHGLPILDFHNACCHSGFGTDSIVGLAATAAEICDTGQCKPVNDAENDWRRQRGSIPHLSLMRCGPFGQQIWPQSIRTSHRCCSTSRSRLRRLRRPTWCYRRQLPLGYWDPMLLEERSSLSRRELFAPPRWKRSCWTVNHHQRRWTPSAGLWNKASRNTPPTAVVVASPSTTMTGAQTLAAIAQQQSVAATKPSPPVANTFGETLRAINDDVRVIKASPFPTATAPQSPTIGILREVHPCRGLVIDFPGEEPILSDDDDEE
uniref:Uncharacterized protein n=1 Tax=Romanomermis culicivorax TaxID=13658 RepID=A0A915IHE2_ROMCU